MDITKFESTFDTYTVDMYNRNAYRTAQEFINKKMKRGMSLAIYGLPETGKTRLLQAIANYYVQQNPETIQYISNEDLRWELEQALKRKDIFLLRLKYKLRKIKVICLDDASTLLRDENIQSVFLRWYNYCKRHSKRVIYTYDCDEEIYSVFQTIASLDKMATAVGIPKPGQNRNIEVIKFIE